MLILALAAGCAADRPVLSNSYVTELPRMEQPPGTHRRDPVRARILAVGDLLIHLPLVLTSQSAEKGFDFTPIFEPVRPWIEAADLALANLETTLTGTRFPWAGYPMFNTPPEFARDVQKVGFDALLRANNHALDYGEYGLNATSQALDLYGIPHTGASRTPEEQERILVLEVAPSIRLAVLNYSYSTNGIPLPHPWSVNLLDPDRIRADIRRARSLPDVDLVAVALHMGEEYARHPSPQQEEYVALALDAGAHIVLGNHPHVVQRIEVRGDRVVIFSLGNFVSNQHGLEREEGLMLFIDVVKEQGITTIEQVSFMPTLVHPYMDGGVRRYRILPVEKGMRDFEAKSDPLIGPDQYQKLRAAWTDVQERAMGGPQVRLLRIDQPRGVK